MNELPTIYIVRCNEFYKIGITENFKQRLLGLQNGNPYPISVVKTYKTNAAQTIEKMLHDALKAGSLHVRGEWFKMNSATLEMVMEVCEIVERGSLK